jgi:hypothetical protein
MGNEEITNAAMSTELADNSVELPISKLLRIRRWRGGAQPSILTGCFERRSSPDEVVVF